MLELRGYQIDSLNALESYLRKVAQLRDPKLTFMHQTERPYRSVSQLPGLPYVCLRVPTGGGTTLIACHALGFAATEYLQAERAVCLRLVPSKTVRHQTLAALRNHRHPYREAVPARATLPTTYGSLCNSAEFSSSNCRSRESIQTRRCKTACSVGCAVAGPRAFSPAAATISCRFRSMSQRGAIRDRSATGRMLNFSTRWQPPPQPMEISPPPSNGKPRPSIGLSPSIQTRSPPTSAPAWNYTKPASHTASLRWGGDLDGFPFAARDEAATGYEPQAFSTGNSWGPLQSGAESGELGAQMTVSDGASAAVVRAWPTLPADAKAPILATVDAANTEGQPNER
jgi:hypothetical protein